ncbi:MAG TPA: acetyl-CoA carboxylase carboxyltransferase subunit alpha [Candidatus Gallacutalibacter stercoravium]|nr:acetyl-CoA carboxylase carboxyltransferase subunit alpha [Candidatus Gallacutalibacter stercoravium]
MNAYDRLTAARAKGRPTSKEYIDKLMGNSFIELHGDRRFGDDKAVIGGVGLLRDMPVTVIGLEKGRDIKERLERNFGSAHPEGYRKALRLMKQAEKFRRPILCLIDTSGAFCGIGAEERGEGQAIAENIMEMTALKTPILSILIGEGESGGALALGVADEVWMLENAVYSVVSPEGCASILWKDSSKAAEAAERLKITSQDLYKMHVIERIIREPKNLDDRLFDSLRNSIYQLFQQKLAMPVEELLNERYDRFRRMGNPEAQEEPVGQ